MNVLESITQFYDFIYNNKKIIAYINFFVLIEIISILKVRKIKNEVEGLPSIYIAFQAAQFLHNKTFLTNTKLINTLNPSIFALYHAALSCKTNDLSS